MHFPEWKCMNLNNKMSLKLVPKGPINNIPALFQIINWCRLGDKPLSEAMLGDKTSSEPMIVNLLTLIFVSRPQWVKHKHNYCTRIEVILLLPQYQWTNLKDNGWYIAWTRGVYRICKKLKYIQNKERKTHHVHIWWAILYANVHISRTWTVIHTLS